MKTVVWTDGSCNANGIHGRGFNQNWHERWLRDGSWKGSNGPVKNRDLWERLFGLVWDGRRDVTFEWIPGHAGDPNNQRVDRLARAAALSVG